MYIVTALNGGIKASNKALKQILGNVKRGMNYLTFYNNFIMQRPDEHTIDVAYATPKIFLNDERINKVLSANEAMSNAYVLQERIYKDKHKVSLSFLVTEFQNRGKNLRRLRYENRMFYDINMFTYLIYHSEG